MHLCLFVIGSFNCPISIDNFFIAVILARITIILKITFISLAILKVPKDPIMKISL